VCIKACVNSAHYKVKPFNERETDFFAMLIDDFDLILFCGKSVQFVFNRIQIYNKYTPYLSAGSFFTNSTR
jgi:hypothetical protein